MLLLIFFLSEHKRILIFLTGQNMFRLSQKKKKITSFIINIFWLGGAYEDANFHARNCPVQSSYILLFSKSCRVISS
jgi:hypothetical protein